MFKMTSSSFSLTFFSMYFFKFSVQVGPTKTQLDLKALYLTLSLPRYFSDVNKIWIPHGQFSKNRHPTWKKKFKIFFKIF